MERIAIQPRDNWQEKVEQLGFDYHTVDPDKYDGDPIYWDETATYKFTGDEVDLIDDVTNELYARCLDAVEYIVNRPDQMLRCGIPQQFHAAIQRSWTRRDLDLYARFDLGYNPTIDPNPKMYEINADTPTSLFEASIIQWFWLEEMIKSGKLSKDSDQFNSIHEQLITAFEVVKQKYTHNQSIVHFFTAANNIEDEITTEYIRDTATTAGLNTKFGYIEDIGWDKNNSVFLDYDNTPITTMFKLYPWEWMLREEYGPMMANDCMDIMEPIWKSVLSNKMLMVIMYELFPNHPNILPASDKEPVTGVSYVKKPIFSREGANIDIIDNNSLILKTNGEYGEEGYVYQQLFALPNFGDKYPVIGSWIIGGKACGMGIREDVSLVTKNTSHFIPHYFE